MAGFELTPPTYKSEALRLEATCSIKICLEAKSQSVSRSVSQECEVPLLCPQETITVNSVVQSERVRERGRGF